MPPLDTHVLVWGRNLNNNLGVGTDVASYNGHVPNPARLQFGDSSFTQIAFGDEHTAALSANGQVFTWSNGFYGQLGHADCKCRNVPTKVENLSSRTIVKVACGGRHTVALTKEGDLFTWGDGWSGELGHGIASSRHTPKKVEALKDEFVIDVLCGSGWTVAFTSSGSVYFCGAAICANNGEATSTPTVLDGIHCKKIRSMDGWTCVTDSGELFTWRDGHRAGDRQLLSVPKLVEGLSGIVCVQISSGVEHTAVLAKDGKLYTYGCGRWGQLGHGNKKDVHHPTLVQALETIDIKEVQCGQYFTMALSTSGYVYMWGTLISHKRSSQENILLPRLVESLRIHNVVEIVCSPTDPCAVVVDPSPSPIRQAQTLQFDNKEHSDLTFVLENEVPIYANVDVLIRKSQYFEAMFRSKMRESTEGVVVLPENISRAVFLKLLEYVCLDDFILDDLQLSRELIVLADMYLLEGLRILCRAHLEGSDSFT